jgi:2-desacetyl-2-hydroxyethyl bacteriochlorophyllide A dehydrogenase
MQIDRVVFTAAGNVSLEPRQIANEPGPGEVLVQLLYSTISPGTELAFLHAMPNSPNKFPLETGYSASGRVICAAADTPYRPDDAVVALAPHGTAAMLEQKWCAPVPEGVDPREASAFRLASIALQGVRKAELQLGQSVLVIGLGIIGNLAGQLARAGGATRVGGVDPVEWRRELASSSGFHTVAADTNTLPEDRTWDVVIEATGVPSVVNEAFRCARRMGRVILLGTSRGVTEQVDFCNAVHRRGLTVLGAHDSVRGMTEDVGHLWTHPSDHRTVLDLLADARLSMTPLISDTVPGREAPAAYDRLTRGDERLMTIAFDWT